MKMIKHMLAIVGAAALLAGCASQDQGRGAVGNEAEVSSGSATIAPLQPLTSDNGIISRSNPLGLTAGNSEPIQQ